MSEARPRLVAVGETPASGAGSAPEPESQESQERRWTLRILFALLAFALAALLVQTWRTRDLHTQIGNLESELAASQAAIAAHEAHLSEVRTQVGELEHGFTRLQALVTRTPAAR